MFGAISDFLYRHRRKFMLSGVVVGGLGLLGKLAERKLLAWQEEQTRKVIDQQKRKQHYERTLDTTRITLLQLIPNIRKVLETELNSELLIRAIKEQPEKKLQLWEQLKIIGFGRSVCTIICTAFAASVSHVMMMVLAANTLDNDVEGSKRKTVSLEVQTRYLSCLQDLIEEQMPQLVAKIMEITTNTITPLPLSRKMTLPQLESILQQITISVTNNRDRSEYIGGDQKPVHSILPWSQYLKAPETMIAFPDCSEELRNLYLLTLDVLNTDDFNEVVNTLVQVGLNYILDEMAGFYYSNLLEDQEAARSKLKSESVDVPGSMVRSDNHTVSECKTPRETEFSHSSHKSEDVCNRTEKIMPSDKKTSSKCVQSNVPTSLPLASESLNANPAVKIFADSDSAKTSVATENSTNLNVVSCVVVKLIPLLSGVLHRALPNSHLLSTQLVPGCSDTTYYSRLVVCSQLEALAYTVYDSLVLS